MNQSINTRNQHSSSIRDMEVSKSSPIARSLDAENCSKHQSRQKAEFNMYENIQHNQNTKESSSSVSSASSCRDDAALVTSSNTTNTTTTGSSGEDRCSSNRASSAPNSDDYGLPVSVDDRLHENSAAHAAVVARLPPPEIPASSFRWSSSDKGSSGGEGGGVQQKRQLIYYRKGTSSSDQSSDSFQEKKRKRHPQPTSPSVLRKRQAQIADSHEDSNGENNSSGSGTEGGYAGEESSNDKPSSCSSLMSSEEERGLKFKANRGSASSPSSSSIDDYDDSSDHPNGSSDIQVFESSSNDESSEDQDDHVPQKLRSAKIDHATRRKLSGRSLLESNYKNALFGIDTKPRIKRGSHSSINPSKAKIPRGTIAVETTEKPSIFSMSCDIMAHSMSYLDPPEVHDLLTAPLSKKWRSNFMMPQDLWRVLCLTEPFHAKFEEEDHEDDQDSDEGSFPMQPDLEVKHLLGKYRLLYTSFVRCIRYLKRIKDDAIYGRPPSVIEYGRSLPPASLRTNENLKNFLRRARGVIVKNKRRHLATHKGNADLIDNPIGVTDENSSVESADKQSRKKKSTKSKSLKFGYSQLTQRLLGPSKTGEAGIVNLPWSCAIYSIVNWMVAFANVEGIQILCLKTLPFLLEDEGQRTTAQRAGLTDIILRGMVLFPNSAKLHIAAFHTIVLLARPLGGREGMLFHCSMVNSNGIFNEGTHTGKNGIAVMLDSMKRFESDVVLQAMSCWSLVNIALAPSQKAVLVKLGGISVVANAMMQHQFNAEVQFRALFALINLVIPSVNTQEENDSTNGDNSIQGDLGEATNTSEKEMLDDAVGQIANLVVVAMKNFCSSESILNRACLVLHNLSLTDAYHAQLLWTPNCYQMLEWCLANYRNDQVLQQSAAGTLHRLQTTLSNDEDLRRRFTSLLHSQQQSSLEQAHREALLQHEQDEQLSNAPIQQS